MKPYNEKFVINTLNKYFDIIKEQSIDGFFIDKKLITSDKINGYMYEKKQNIQYNTITLRYHDNIIMNLDFKEIEGAYESIRMARGKVGIVGLGIGYSAIEIASKKEVSEVIVYEKDTAIIEMFKNNFISNNLIDKDYINKIKVINCDVFDALSDTFDYFFVDIYGYSLSPKIVQDYKKLNDIHKIKEYTFFGVEEFLLSCSYNEIVWVYIPENWMAMSKDMAAALESSRYINDYYKLDEKLVSDILSKFKDVLNDE